MTVDRNVIVIADPHLGVVPGDVEEMGRFIGSLNPGESDLLFLGDLFHIWAGPAKYHTDPVRYMLDLLKTYRSKQGRVYLVLGNRDVFLTGHPENRLLKDLPFDSIFPEHGILRLGNREILAVHGDTVNRQDVRYLKWRRTLRHPWFEGFFNLLPVSLVKRIMFRLEADLQHTNMDFRRTFPVAEWDRFVGRAVEEHGSDLLLCGHFHPKELIVKKSGNTTALVVPDWIKEGAYLKVTGGLSYELCRFRASSGIENSRR